MNNLYQILLIMGVGWAISGVVQLALKPHKKNSDIPYAITIIIVFLLTILDNLLRPTFIDMSILEYIYPITRLSYLLIGPALFIYVRALMITGFRVKLIEALHLIPFVVFFVCILYNPGIIHPKIIVGYGSEHIINEVQNSKWTMFLYWDSTIHLSRFIYLAIILLYLQKLKRKLPDVVSVFNMQNTLSWFRNLIVFYTIIYFLAFLSFIFFSEENISYQSYSAFARNIPP
ncbi:MAG: hypothetical protein WBM99_02235, partial [Psychromonas sp.]